MRFEVLATAVLILAPCAWAQPTVHMLRVPESGIQPQVELGTDGTLHLLYYKGDPKGGDLFYVKRTAGEAGFSAPVRVNSQPGSAVAIGNDRGGQLARGKNGRVHVAWNGSAAAEPKGPKNPGMAADNANNGVPMLYARSNDKGDAFEPQRNVITSAFGLDGGGGIAADSAGTVYVVFHADPAGATGKSETDRRVFAAVSLDDGATFAPERPVSDATLGACGCCGLKALAGPQGHLGIAFRSASTLMDRNAVLLQSTDSGKTFSATPLQPWRIGACPMTTSSLYRTEDGLAVARETRGNIFAAAVPWAGGATPTPTSPARPNRSS